MSERTDAVSLAPNDVAELKRGFEVSLRARNRSPKTIRSYLEAVDLYREFAVTSGLPTAVDCIKRDNVEEFIADQLSRWTPKTAQIRYGSLQQFFRWCDEEGETPSGTPMAKMKPPSLPDVPVPVVSDDDLSRLLKACEGTSFACRRDMAIIRLFIDCGLRLSEVSDLKVSDLDWNLQVVIVMGKGARPRSVPFGARTAQALDRYLRARKQHKSASSSSLWLGKAGSLRSNGVAQILRRRCIEAHIDKLHPHQLRHTAAHTLAKGGMGDSDMMRIFGWRSRQMLTRYGASAADERAHDAFRRLALGDRL